MKTLSNTLKLFSALLLVVAIGLTYFAIWAFSQFPSSAEIRGCMTTKMYHLYLCPSSPEYVKLKDISPYLQKAVVLTEDSSFFQHGGFDLEEIQRSLKKDVDTGHFARGGSTISQQLAKNMFLTEEKTLTRKILEAIITLQLEKNLKKKEILERYLNIVHLGKNIFGVKAAAEFYFHKSARNLNIPEAAFLTFLLPSPEKYAKSFLKNSLTPFAAKRLRQIIESMHVYKRIDDVEYAAAQADLQAFLPKDRIENEPAAETSLSPEEAAPTEEVIDPEDD